MYENCRFLGLNLFAILVGCASVVSDTNTYTLIETQPEGARCELHGHGFSQVLYTSGSVQLPAGAAPIILVCRAKGYLTATLNIDTEIDGWIFGNLLLGGPIGIIVDGARGAGQKYPPKVSVQLEPEIFASPAARDAWFDRQRLRIDEKWNVILATLRQSCEEGATEGDPCADDLKRVTRRRKIELQQLDLRRIKAKVENSGA